MISDSPDDTERKAEELTFEEALGKLDETVQALEAGGLPLSEATRLFADGMKLARVCSEMLSAAELKVTRIKTAYGEQMRFVQDGDDAPTR